MSSTHQFTKNFLGYNKVNEAVLIGVGHLGGALMSFKDFWTLV